jgi:hypothetical protein
MRARAHTNTHARRYVGLLTTVLLAPVVLVLVASGAISLVAIPKEVYLIVLLEGKGCCCS